MTKAADSCSDTSDPKLLCVQISVPVEIAATFASSIVENRLGACVQQLPVRSTYCWNGSVESTDEVLLLIKTTSRRYTDLEEWVRDKHPYDVPEIVSYALHPVLPAYANWVQDSTRELRRP